MKGRGDTPAFHRSVNLQVGPGIWDPAEAVGGGGSQKSHMPENRPCVIGGVIGDAGGGGTKNRIGKLEGPEQQDQKVKLLLLPENSL